VIGIDEGAICVVQVKLSGKTRGARQAQPYYCRGGGGGGGQTQDEPKPCLKGSLEDSCSVHTVGRKADFALPALPWPIALVPHERESNQEKTRFLLIRALPKGQQGRVARVASGCRHVYATILLLFAARPARAAVMHVRGRAYNTSLLSLIIHPAV
jgi:hypothetical protein